MVLIKRSVILILISAFFIYFGIMMIIIFMPQYLLALGTPRPILQIITTIFLATLFIFPYIFGKYSDKIQNRRHFIIIGTAGMILTPILLLFTTDLILITLIYFTLGVFASASSIFFTLYIELVQNSSKWISYYNALTALGWFISALTSGLFIEFFGSITSIFYLSFFGLLISMAFIIFIKEDRQLILNAEHGIVDTTIPQSNHDDENLLSKSIYFGIFFRSMGIAPILVILVVIMNFHLSSNAEIGFLIGLNPLLQFFFMILLGMLITGKNEKFFAFLGYGLSILVIFGFLLATDFWSFLLSQFLVSLSYSIYWMTTITYISRNSTPKNKGLYIGKANTFTFAGNAVGGLLFGFLLTLVNTDYYTAMYFMIAFPIIATIIILLGRKKLFSFPKGI